MDKIKAQIQSLASQLLPEIIDIRRHIHMNPELSFEEYNTASFIASKLKSNHIPFQDGIAGTGIVVFIEGKNPSLKTIALRADMDALPILEQNDVEYKSKKLGVMHACGHDVHTASMLGTVMILNELKNNLKGKIKVIFQPGEEKLPGGASLMIKQGVLQNPVPSAIFAQHVFPSLESGKVGFRSGMYMASTDELYLTVFGKGGHAAMPKDYNNPILIASAILEELDKKIMNKTNPPLFEGKQIPTVLAFGKMTADGATNVIPNEVKLEGTFRTMHEAWREEAHKIIKQTAESIAKKMGGSCDFNIVRGYPFLVNDEQLTAKAKKSSEEYLGKENVKDLDLRMTGEDFAFYSQQVPACFYRIGTGNVAKGITSGVHTSTFDIDEKALETAMGLMAWIVFKELGE